MYKIDTEGMVTALEFKKIAMLKIFTGEDIMLGDVPLYKAIINEARALNLAGGTVFKGVGGYAASVRGINSGAVSFFSGIADLPVLVEIADNRKNIERLLPFLEKNADHALVLVEEAEYLSTAYTRERERQLALGENKKDCGTV